MEVKVHDIPIGQFFTFILLDYHEIEKKMDFSVLIYLVDSYTKIRSSVFSINCEVS